MDQDMAMMKYKYIGKRTHQKQDSDACMNAFYEGNSKHYFGHFLEAFSLFHECTSAHENPVSPF